MGGEPFADENQMLTYLVATAVREEYPDIKIYIWTGYTYEELIHKGTPRIKEIFDTVDVLIDGPYIEEQRDITLPMRGSKNQRIINLKELK